MKKEIKEKLENIYWAYIVPSVVALFILLVLIGMGWNVWNWFDCYSRPIAEAPVRCISSTR